MFIVENPKRKIFIMSLALLLGVIGSMAGELLIKGISFFTNLFYYQTISFHEITPLNHQNGVYGIFIPAIGGLIIGVLARYGNKGIRGHGIPEVIEKVITNEAKVPWKIALLKPLSSALSIGSGAPFGAEGPIIATGAGIGSLIGQWLPVSVQERKILLACGAAAGVTYILGTPIAAILICIELLLFEFSHWSYTPVAMSAALAAVIRYNYLTHKPFLMLDHILPNTLTIPMFLIYLASGFLFGFIAVFLSRSVYFFEDLFAKLPIHWMWWPAIGGIIVGIVGFYYPENLGAGYFNIQNAVGGTLTFKFALALLLVKGGTWAMALGSGTSGGTLAPILTVGALSGVCLGHVLHYFFPHLMIDVSTIALLGMACMFAGSARAVFTSIFFAFEMIDQSMVIPPLIISCFAAHMISCLIMKNSIMTEKIERHGVKIPSEYFGL